MHVMTHYTSCILTIFRATDISQMGNLKHFTEALFTDDKLLYHPCCVKNFICLMFATGDQTSKTAKLVILKIP